MFSAPCRHPDAVAAFRKCTHHTHRHRHAFRVTNLHKLLKQQVDEGPLKPEQATIECLTILRKADVDVVRQWLPADKITGCTRQAFLVGGEAIAEASPFVGCSQVMDAAARRVLPGHLLRRSQVLSSFHIGPTCHQRVTVTGCTGEETVFKWVMVQEGEGEWMVCEISRDPLQDEEGREGPLPKPHPRLSPEAVIHSQLRALQRGDVSVAARYNLWGKSMSGGWDLNLQRLRSMLRQHPFQSLLTHSSVQLGAAALSSPHHFVQEVEVMQAATAVRSQASMLFVWDMRLQGNGCWATCGIRPAEM